MKLPLLKRGASNPEDLETTNSSTKEKGLGTTKEPKTYYVSNLYRCLKKHETTYLMNLYRQHFYQHIEIMRWGKSIKITHPRK